MLVVSGSQDIPVEGQTESHEQQNHTVVTSQAEKMSTSKKVENHQSFPSLIPLACSHKETVVLVLHRLGHPLHCRPNSTTAQPIGAPVTL